MDICAWCNKSVAEWSHSEEWDGPMGMQMDWQPKHTLKEWNTKGLGVFI